MVELIGILCLLGLVILAVKFLGALLGLHGGRQFLTAWGVIGILAILGAGLVHEPASNRAALPSVQPAVQTTSQPEPVATKTADAPASTGSDTAVNGMPDAANRRVSDTVITPTYTNISINNFLLDGKTMASAQERAMLSGFYIKQGNIERLFSNMLAIAMSREYGQLNAGVGLLTEDANRETRAYLLECQQNPVASQTGCPVTLLGHASMCTVTSLVGSHEEPCLVVENSQR